MKDGLRRHLREYHERALESGLDTVGRNTDVIARDVARMAAVLDQALPAIMEQLARAARAGVGSGLTRTSSSLPTSRIVPVRAVIAMSSKSRRAHSSARAPV
jgi:hypothetical protein